MNKTININLASTFFHIDESAYKKLKAYLNSLEKGFNKTQGKEEILKDIEARIAELFQKIKTNSEYVINETDVDKVISILGQPEDFISEEEDETPNFEASHKKLFRDPDDKYIAGVASGVGYYFGIDSSWIRLLWILLILFSGGSFIVIYILFWILVPVAKTTAEKLKMKGEPVNISTIEKKIKEEFEDVSSKIKDIDYDKASNSVKKKSKAFFQIVENFLKPIPKIIFKILGVLFLIVSISSIIGLLIGGLILLFFGTVVWPFHFFDIGIAPNIIWVLSIFLFLLIPFLFLFSMGVRIIRGHSSTFGTVGRFVLLGIWIISILSFTFISSNAIRNQRVTASKKEVHTLPITLNDTIYVSAFDSNLKSPEWEFKKSRPFSDLFNEIQDNKGAVSLAIQKSNDSKTFLQMKASAKSHNKEKAKDIVESLKYDWSMENKTLFLRKVLLAENKAIINTKEMNLSLQLAEGQVIYINKNLKTLLSHPIKNDHGFRTHEVGGYFWKMGSESLECLNCEENESKLKLHYQDSMGKEKLHLEVDENGIQLKTK